MVSLTRYRCSAAAVYRGAASKGSRSASGRCVVCEGVAQPAGQVLAPRFVLREAKGMGEHHLKLTDPERETILCKDPFQSRDERIERLIRSI